jgi:predicted transcriptional regulator
MIENILSSLNLKPEESRLYHKLLESGAMTAGSLAKNTGLSRPSVYDYLKTLQETGLVKQSLRFGVKSFYAAPPEQIGRLLENRIAELETQKSAFEKILPGLAMMGQLPFSAPRFQLFEGPEGVKQVLMDMLLYRDLETRSFWPIQTMIETLSPEFFHKHNKQRIENNLSVKAIWPLRKTVALKEFPFLGGGKGFLRDIRIAPEFVDMQMGYWIYGRKTAFLSSSKEQFGFIIESDEFSQMMTTQHEILWKLSTKLPINPDDVQPFLREIGITL